MDPGVVIALLFEHVFPGCTTRVSADSSLGDWAQSYAPAGWADDIKLNELVDRNPDPKIVEVDMTAKLADVQIGGKTVHAWTYNGSIPGLLIKTHVGDRLIVHFKNELDGPTTVHWHGVRVPIRWTRAGRVTARRQEGRVIHLRLRSA